MKETVARGYGGKHQAERARWQRLLDKGLRVICACQRLDCPGHRGRCQTVITNDTPFDLGHVDADRTRYSGLECVPCNRSAGARASNGQLKTDLPIGRPATANRW